MGKILLSVWRTLSKILKTLQWSPHIFSNFQSSSSYEYWWSEISAGFHIHLIPLHSTISSLSDLQWSLFSVITNLTDIYLSFEIPIDISWSYLRWSSVIFGDIQWYSVLFSDIQWSSSFFGGLQWSSVIFSDLQWSSVIFSYLHVFSVISSDIQ